MKIRKNLCTKYLPLYFYNINNDIRIYFHKRTFLPNFFIYHICDLSIYHYFIYVTVKGGGGWFTLNTENDFEIVVGPKISLSGSTFGLGLGSQIIRGAGWPRPFSRQKWSKELKIEISIIPGFLIIS